MPARSRSRTLHALVVLVPLFALACGEPGKPDSASSSTSSEEDAVSFEVESNDELLRRARESMKAGELASEVRAELMSSDAPEHARARRLLASIAGEAGPDDADGGEPVPKIRVTSSKGTRELTPRPVPAVEPPSGGATGGDSSPAAATTEAAAAPKLAVVTRLELQGKGKNVTLRLHAARPVEVGMVEQKSSGTVRLVARSAGALPAVLQARPSRSGVTVTDVRRGEGTLQIAVQLDEGWRAKQPRRDAGGASVGFKGG